MAKCSTKREKSKTRAEWLRKRKDRGLGASEAATVVGLSPWQTARDLFEIKTGRKKPKDISDNEEVQQGVRLEPVLRDLFKATHPQFKVTHHPYDMLYQAERPWAFATLDGELKETATNKKGILEIKTSTPLSAKGWSEWKDKIPNNYYMQILHQLASTGFDFVIVYACLFGNDGGFTVREYRFEREDFQSDIDWLVAEEEKFWDSVQNDKIPSLTLIL